MLSATYLEADLWAYYVHAYTRFLKKRNLVNNRLYQRQTVRCQSNGNRASSVSDLPALAAQTSAGGTAFSRLPWPAMLPGRPHGPTILASLACLSLYSPTPPVIFRRRQPNQSTLVLSTAWAATAVYSPAPCRSLRRPRRRPPPWCSRRGVVNDVHPTTVVLLQPLVFLPQPPKAAPVVPHAPASRGRLCCRRGLTAPTIPTAGQAIPVKAHAERSTRVHWFGCGVRLSLPRNKRRSG